MGVSDWPISVFLKGQVPITPKKLTNETIPRRQVAMYTVLTLQVAHTGRCITTHVQQLFND